MINWFDKSLTGTLTTIDHPIFELWLPLTERRRRNYLMMVVAFANGKVMHFETRKHLICIYNNPLLLHLSIDYCGKIPQESMHSVQYLLLWLSIYQVTIYVNKNDRDYLWVYKCQTLIMMHELQRTKYICLIFRSNTMF